MHALNVEFLAPVPAVAARKYNLPPKLDSAIANVTIIMIELIVDVAALLCHRSYSRAICFLSTRRVKEIHDCVCFVFTCTVSIQYHCFVDSL